MAGRLNPTEEQRKAIERLLRDYQLAIKLVNAATTKARLERGVRRAT
jgi:hypothetical protein